MLKPNAFAYSDFHLNDNLSFSFSFFVFVYMKMLKERDGEIIKYLSPSKVKRYNNKASRQGSLTVHSFSSLTPVACEHSHNYMVQINSQEVFHSSQKIVFQCQDISPPIMGS